MKNWQELTEYNTLWVIDRDPKDAWFCYFDKLMQLELSRSLRQFKNHDEAWIFSGAKYVPSTTILLADFSDGTIAAQQKIWQSLGSPKTVIFSSEKSAFVTKFTSVAPDSFYHVKDLP